MTRAEERTSVGTDSSTLTLRPGTIDHVVGLLQVWLRHPRKGMAWVEYTADSARDAAIERLNDAARLTVTSASSREDWESLFGQLQKQTGLVHIQFSATIGSAVLPQQDVRQFAQALNLDREQVFSLPFKQVWWLPNRLVGLLRF